GFSEEEAHEIGPFGPQAPPPKFQELSPQGIYPWSHPVVFRSGRYLVHRVTRPLGHFGKLPPRK
ncbi:MAG: hypothetical protein KDA84_13525, partial [Planctomycetaceae bacterium]|nr:hypothetical protein [Planctomycetaceae bacterium]